MITRRFTVAAAAGLAVASLALAGCSSPANAPAASEAPQEKVELSMLVNITPNLTEAYWNALVGPFEAANPNISVKIVPPVKSVSATLPTLLASGDVPDVVETLTPNATLAPELVDLSKYDWAKKGPLADQYKMDGKNLVAGAGFQVQGTIFYNKQAFKDAGITETPTTMDEFEADLKKLKDAGWTPIQTGGEWMTQLGLQYTAIPTVIGNESDWYKGISSGDLKWSDTYRKSVERYASWIKDGYIPADSVGVKYADAEASFLAGKAAMYPMGAWFSAAESKATDKPEIGVFRAPAEAGVKTPAQIANMANPYIIMKASKHQDAAAKLVEYLVTDKAAVISQLQADGNFRKGYEYQTTPLGEELQKIIAGTPAKAFTPSGDGYGGRTVAPGYNAELNTQTQGLIAGGSADAMLKSMDAWFAAQ
jgi:multiple sugar transport system substrate-binding protein/raffinose/stachyose/melibiose transport system substrate-binding protein